MDATELALLAGICASPADDTARLVMADYYSETGREERGEFIRVQIELARTEKESGWVPDEKMLGTQPIQSLEMLFKINNADRERRVEKLRERQRELFANRCRVWFPNFTGAEFKWLLPGQSWHTNGCWFSRGYLSSLTCTSSAFLQHAGNLIWRPDQTVECSGGIYTQGLRCHYGCDKCDGTGRISNPCPPTAQPIEEVTLTDWPRMNVVGDGSSTGTGLTYSINGVPGEYDLLSLTDILRIKPPIRALRADEVVRGIFGVRFPGVKFNLPSSYALGENVTLNPQRLHLQIRVPQELVDEMDRGAELSDLARDRAEAWQFAERAAAAVYTVPEGRLSRVEREIPAGATGHVLPCMCLTSDEYVPHVLEMSEIATRAFSTVSLAPTVRIRTTRGTMYAPFAGQCSVCRRVFVAIRQDRPQSA